MMRRYTRSAIGQLTGAARATAVRWLAVACTMALLHAAGGVALACTGDCNGDGSVTIEELIKGVDIAATGASMDVCPDFDANGDRTVTVEEIVRGVSAALDGCPAALISTVAGSGLAGYNGDDIAPIEAALYLPQDTTVGPDGFLYILDWNNHRVRRIRNGKIETIAGSGEIGEAKDGDALYAQFNHPTNVAFDHEGRMVIAAWHNSTVKRLDLATGMLTNVAGTGARSFGGDGGPANSAALNLPSSVAIDSNDNILISDQANFRIRMVEPNGTINTVCGSMAGYAGDGGPASAAKINSPAGQAAAPAGRIVIDSHNRIYIADTGNHAIRMIDSDGTISTLAGNGQAGYTGDGGPAIDAQLNTPSDLAITPNGTIFIADTMNSVVRMIRPDGTISTIAGTGDQGFAGDEGPATAAQLDRPYGVSVAPNGDVYVADTHNHRIRKITSISNGPPPTPHPTPTPQIIPCTNVAGSICTYAGDGEFGFNGDGKDTVHTALYWPFDIEFTPSGRRIVQDWNNHKVREILPDDTFTTIMGTDFVGDGPADLSDLTAPGAPPLSVNLNHPTDVQELPGGDLLVMCWHNHKLRTLAKDSGLVRVMIGRGAGYKGDGMAAKDALVNQPPHGVLDANGNLFFIDQRNQRIRVIYNFVTDRDAGIIDTVVGTGPDMTTGKGGFNGDGPALQTQLNFPAGGNPEPSGGLAIDANGILYFADTLNHRIRRVQFSSADFKTGVVTTIAGNGSGAFSGDGGQSVDAQVNLPGDLEIGPDNNLYFADTNNNRVRMINLTDGTIATVAGVGTKGYSGDGGAALSAQFNRPFGVAFDGNGDLYVSDTFNSRIRKVKLGLQPPTGQAQ